MTNRLRITILGLSITSSWGNGHATTYRGLVKALARRGHSVLFLERDTPWYSEHRDLPEPPYGTTRVYAGMEELIDRYAAAIRQSDLVIVGSYVPDGVAVGDWACREARGITAFYDIDTPVTLAKLRARDFEYIAPRQIGSYDCYLSFTGGPVLKMLEEEFGAPLARPLYCSVDPDLYGTDDAEPQFDLGYIGTYSADRQPALERMMLQPAEGWPEGKFVVAGPQYPESIAWPDNVARIEHLPPGKHRQFYNSQRFTLNLTRSAMRTMGYSPSVRLFEAAACGTPIISDWWPGLSDFLRPGHEVLLSNSREETLHWLNRLSEVDRRRIGTCARRKVLNEHTAEKRAEQLEAFFEQAATVRRARPLQMVRSGGPAVHT